jgi:chloramphenicol O-acetyltransferase type A
LHVIDLETWPRRSQFEFFRGFANPHFSLTAQVDVTRLVEELKPEGVSVFNAVLFAVMGAANALPELRTRFRGDQVVEHEVVHASITVPIEDERFAFCDIEYAPDWPAFDARCQAAVEHARRQSVLIDHIAQRDDWIFLSCLPWVAFTSMTNPTSGPDDCVPRITWGRFERLGDSWRLPVCVEVHHGLVDGLHVGRFYQGLQQRLSTAAI